MVIQKVENVYDLNWNGLEGDQKILYRDVFLENEKQFSAYHFEQATTDILFQHFKDAESECQKLVEANLPLPAYDHCIKASHTFNILDARGVISVTERAAYIARVRDLAKATCTKWPEIDEQ